MRFLRALVVVLFLFASTITASAQTGQPERVAVTPLSENSVVHPGTSARLALDTTAGEGLHLQSNRPRDEYLIPTTLTFEPPAGVTVREIVYPEAMDFRLRGTNQILVVFERRFAIGVVIDVASDVSPGTLTLPARLRYQACDDSVCFPPTSVSTSWSLTVAPKSSTVRKQHADVFRPIRFGTGEAPGAAPPARPAAVVTPPANLDTLARFDRFEILGTAAYSTSAEFVEFINNAETGVKPQGMFEGKGPLAILAIVFLGGLALNLTPCVLPMIPINLAIIGAGSQRANRRRGLFLGASYGAAMAVVYGVLGVVVILTAGTFGTINASPWFNAGIAALFVVLGLAMFDVISIDFSRLSSRIRFAQEGRGTAALAFGMGAVAALLAGACVAPVVIQVVVFASDLYSSGSTVALALPFVLGLGMALPWPIAGAGFSVLPKSGAWMVRVKQVMGVFILATAAYYGYIAYGIFASRFVDPETVRASVQAKLAEGWYSSLDEGLAVAERERKLVLVDLWATWCKNCVVMDETTLKDPAVTARLANYVRIKFQAEDPSVAPASTIMKRIGAFGLPAYVILRPPSRAN